MLDSLTRYPRTVSSALIPGTGQLYNEDYLEGVLFLLLGNLALYLTFISLIGLFYVGPAYEIPSIGSFIPVAIMVVMYLPVWMYSTSTAYRADKLRLRGTYVE